MKVSVASFNRVGQLKKIGSGEIYTGSEEKQARGNRPESNEGKTVQANREFLNKVARKKAGSAVRKRRNKKRSSTPYSKHRHS